jgi:hypothetical protein
LESESIQLPEIGGIKEGLQNAAITHEQFMNLRDGYAQKVPGFQGYKAMTHEDFKKMKESFIDKINKNSD